MLDDPSRKGIGMQTSARNQLPGTVTTVTIGAVMAEVVVDVNGQQIVAAITKDSAERLGLEAGAAVTVIVKATDVMIGVDS
jgi:molybdate transport system regulatory protein